MVQANKNHSFCRKCGHLFETSKVELNYDCEDCIKKEIDRVLKAHKLKDSSFDILTRLYSDTTNRIPYQYVLDSNSNEFLVYTDLFVEWLVDRDATYMNLVKGCLDYGGGYRSNQKELDIFHHGIQTVINVIDTFQKKGLENDMQLNVLNTIGEKHED